MNTSFGELGQGVCILELPLSALKWGDSSSSFEQARLVRRHLRYILERTEKWLVVTVELTSDGFFVARSHLPYLEIAGELGRSKIRAVLLPGQDLSAVEAALQRIGGRRLGVNEQLHDLVEKAFDSEHVFFFGRPLPEDQQISFRERFQRACPLKNPVTEFDLDGTVAIVNVEQQEGDRAFAQRLLEEMVVFHEVVCAIESYQGRRFPPV